MVWIDRLALYCNCLGSVNQLEGRCQTSTLPHAHNVVCKTGGGGGGGGGHTPYINMSPNFRLAPVRFLSEGMVCIECFVS